jgi:hypothetical protein
MSDVDVYVVLPLEDKADFLACCDLNDVGVYESVEAADYAAYKLNQSRPNGARYKWRSVEMPLRGRVAV